MLKSKARWYYGILVLVVIAFGGWALSMNKFPFAKQPPTAPAPPAPSVPTPAPESPVPNPTQPMGGGNENDNRIVGEYDLARLFPNLVLRQAKPTTGLVSLTFDDGPDDDFTPKILDVLKSKNVKSTFFCIGKRIEENAAVTARILKEGHTIGNHTYTHPSLTRFPADVLKSEIDRMESALIPFGVNSGGMFRPPYGAVDVKTAEEIGKLGYRVSLWSVDSLDWRSLTKDVVTNNVLPHVVDGSVLLFHSAGGPGEDLTGTVEALPGIIDTVRQKGFHFVTFHDMFPQGKP